MADNEDEGTAELVAHLVAIGIRAGPATKYAAALVDEGYDSIQAFDELSLEELAEDVKFKKGHLKQVEAFRAKPSVAPASTAGGLPRGYTLDLDMADGDKDAASLLRDIVGPSAGAGSSAGGPALDDMSDEDRRQLVVKAKEKA